MIKRFFWALLFICSGLSRTFGQNICGSESETLGLLEVFFGGVSDLCPSEFSIQSSNQTMANVSWKQFYDPILGEYRIIYSINWTPGEWGSVTFYFYQQKRKNKLFKGCHDDGSPELKKAVTFFKEPASTTTAFPLGKIFMDGLPTSTISVTKGKTVLLKWDRSGYLGRINRWSVTKAGVTIFNGSIANTVNIPASQEGTMTLNITLYNDVCNAQYPQGQYTITVLPSCANDNPNVSVSKIPEKGEQLLEVIDGGYPGNPGYKDGGGFLIEQSIDYKYKLSILDATDFTDHYTVTHNGGTDISYLQSGTDISFSISKSVGWYEFNLLPKYLQVDQFCPDFSSINIFVGGQNVTFVEPCTIYLPQYLIDHEVVGVDKVIRNFMFTVISKRGVIAEPGITLTDGAVLKIDFIDPDLTTDPDKDINFIENIAYNDIGYPIASGRSYFNEMGKPLQSQVKNYTSETILATGTIYDQFGRSVITTLPAPVHYTGTIIDVQCPTEPIQFSKTLQFTYKGNFVEKSAGVEYDYTAFDSDINGTGKEINPDAVSNLTEGTLGWYYGGQSNPAIDSKIIEPFVATTSYPYQRTVFYDDGSGEVKNVASAGDFHRMGTGHVAESRVEDFETTDHALLDKYLVMRNAEVFPNDENKPLDHSYLTGSVYKVYNKDENGKEQISYYDKSNQLIITKYVPDNTVSYSFYDDAGRLRCSVSPNGVNKYELESVKFDQIDQATYVYNHQGWLLKTIATDAGMTQFIYRKDGKLRFLQNAKQAPDKFSYVNYDRTGRAIEGGEFKFNGTPLLFGTSDFDYLLETKGSADGLTAALGTKSDVILTFYDEVDLTSPIVQEFVMGKASYTQRSGETQSWYSYDERGRIVKAAQRFPVIGDKVIDYKYGPDGNVIEVAYQRNTADAFYHVYEYDLDARLKKVFTSLTAPVYDASDKITNTTDLTEQAEYQYYVHGPLKRVELAGNLQGIDYTYTVEGWLKSINHYDKAKDPGSDGDDVFGMTLEYYTGDYTRAGTNIGSLADAGLDENFNGSIKAMAWFTQKPNLVSSDPTAYKYTYDDKYQLKNADWGNVNDGTFVPLGLVNTFKEGDITYDANGNISQLKRYNELGNVKHDFTSYNYYSPSDAGYSRYTNQLKSIANYASSYTYNAVGQLESVIKNSEVTYAVFDAYGMMKAMSEDQAPDPSIDPSDILVKYFYDDNGMRYKKETYIPGTGINKLYYTTWYVRDTEGNIVAVYDNKTDIGNNNDPSDDLIKTETPIYGSGRLGIYFDHSKVSKYELTDHLGNVRATVKTSGNLAVVESYADYYPFGMVLRDKKSSEGYRFGYQGQYAEKDDEAGGLNAFELRMYDPVIGRWLSVDPMNEFYSPYVAMGNNPISTVDASGGCTLCPGDAEVGATFEHPVYGTLTHYGNGAWGNEQYGSILDDVVINPSANSEVSWWEIHKAGNVFNDFMYEANKFNPIANVANGVHAYFTGTDLERGNPMSGVDATVSIASAIPIGRIAGTGATLLNATTKYVVIGKNMTREVIPFASKFSNSRVLNLPNLGSPKANYYQNMSRLRGALRNGEVPFDLRNGSGGFLGAERNLLLNRGYTLQGNTWVK